MDRLDRSEVQAALTSRTFGCRLVVLRRTASTNDVAKDLAAHGAPEGTVVVADEQTRGRGRLGRPWLAPPGTCLLCSILFRPALSACQAARLTMLCSLAAADALEQVAHLRVALKWPNDLIVQCRTADAEPRSWRKLAGLLTETGVVGEHLDFAVVGIGINVNVPPEMLPTLAPDATSVLAEVGRGVNRVSLLAGLLAAIERRYKSLQAGGSPSDEWAAQLATLGQPVEVRTSDGVLSGVAESVDEDGALLLRTRDGVVRRLLAGDVTLTRS